MNTLVVLSNRGSYATKYFLHLTNVVNKIRPGLLDWTTLLEYPEVDQDNYDAVIYNTFPDETHSVKFHKNLTEVCDNKFRSFRGVKILFDTHDDGSCDGFARFANIRIPRIKVNPSCGILDRLNVILATPFFVYPRYLSGQKDRPYKIVCAMRTKGMPHIRQYVAETIGRFSPVTEWLEPMAHANRLCKTLINIVPNGTGSSCRSHVDTLAAGALLLAEKDITDVKILPYADLVEGKNFVSFDLSDVCDKLDWLLNNRDEVERIRLAGRETFKKGYDMERSARELIRWLT